MSDLPTLGFKDHTYGSCKIASSPFLILPFTVVRREQLGTRLSCTHRERASYDMHRCITFIEGVGFFTLVA